MLESTQSMEDYRFPSFSAILPAINQRGNAQKNPIQLPPPTYSKMCDKMSQFSRIPTPFRSNQLQPNPTNSG